MRWRIVVRRIVYNVAAGVLCAGCLQPELDDQSSLGTEPVCRALVEEVTALGTKGRVQSLLLPPEPEPEAGAWEAGIASLGGGKYRVLRDHVSGQVSEWLKGKVLVPRLPGAGCEGTSSRIFGAQKSTVTGQLGLRNGDKLLRLNGVTPKTADEYFILIEWAKELETIHLEIKRRGVPMTLTFELR